MSFRFTGSAICLIVVAAAACASNPSATGSAGTGGGSGGGAMVCSTATPCGAKSKWSKAFGDAADNQASNTVAVDVAANVFIAGTFPGSIDFGGGKLTSTGASDLFLAKFDPAGTPLWSKSVA